MMHTSPWDQGRREAALARGPHKSAKEHIEFLRQEYTSMIKKGHWVLLPADLVRANRNLRLSPLGVVPQRERRPRTISDYSYFGVNDDTVPLAHQSAMQFGRTLPRILQRIHESNPKYGPVFLSKIDIADGFYRIGLRPADALRLGVLFPSRPHERQLIGIPLVLPMGWAESPPAFCSSTETVADLANTALSTNDTALGTPHRLEVVSESAPGPAPVAPTSLRQSAIGLATPGVTQTHERTLVRPLQQWDVYVDDFLGVAQGGKRRLTRIKRALLHSLDRVFRPLDSFDLPDRQEPASVKKLLKGDATWSTRKTVLGWTIDTVKRTIELPQHRIDRLNGILNAVRPGQRTVATKDWHKVLGELRSMALAIPGARGLFSLLQEAFRHEEKTQPRLRLTKALHGFLDDFRALAKDVTSRPTRIDELIATQPAVLGACDAAGTGMGGVAFITTPDGDLVPCLWRQPFSLAIQRELVSFRNPHGTITNSDLELCGNIAHHDVVAQIADLRERTMTTLSDNVANVYWLRKGSTTTIGPAAYLLRLQSHHQRFHRYVPRHDYIPGDSNVMADICSRAWHLSDSQLLSSFNRRFPQRSDWRLCHLSPQMNSALTSSLFKKASVTASVQSMPSEKMPTGSSGFSSAHSFDSTRSFPGFRIRSPISSYSPSDIGMDVWPQAKGPSQLNMFRTSSARLVRRSKGWGPTTRAKH